MISRLSVLVLVGALSLLVSSLAAAGADAPTQVDVSVWTNDYPEDPNEPDQYLRGKAKDVGSSSLRWDLVLSHEGTRFEDVPKDLGKLFRKEAWLKYDVSCVNVFDHGDEGVSAVLAAQVTDSGWMDPELYGGFPQFFREAWVVIEFFDGGPNGDGDWFRSGQGDLDPTLQPPAPPFDEERALEVCLTGDVPADGDEPCFGPEAVEIDGVTYGPWFDEDGNPMEVCETWRTKSELRTSVGGHGYFFDGDIRIK